VKCIVYWLRHLRLVAPYDSFLLPQLKKKLSRPCFGTQRSLEVAVEGSLGGISDSSPRSKDGLFQVREAQAQILEKGIEINGDSADK